MGKNILHDPRLQANRCMDGVTGSQKHNIVRYPEHCNLIVADGGSYTHAKDIPYIGRLANEFLHATKTHGLFDW